MGPPNEADREAILKIHLRKIPCSSDICIKELASITKGYTGADISLICREAAIAALEVSFLLFSCQLKSLIFSLRCVSTLFDPIRRVLKQKK